MKKLLLLIFIIVVFTGCAQEPDTSPDDIRLIGIGRYNK